MLLYDPISGAWTFQESTSGGFNTLKSGGWGAGWTILPGDFNADGVTDLFFSRAASGDWVKFTNIGNGNFTAQSGLWAVGWNITVIDFNGDRRDDLFIYNPGSGRWYKGMNVGSSFDWSITGVWMPGFTVYPADFNGDGLGDLFIYDRNGPSDPMSGYWYQVFSHLDQSFSYAGGNVYWGHDIDVVPADYDGNGQTDLFLYRSTGQFYRVKFIQPTPAKNTVQPSTGAIYDTVTWGTGWTLRKGDFNGDRRDDLFVYNPSTGAWTMVIMNADGTLGYFSGGWGTGWDVSVSEFNGDGKADLLLYKSSAGVVLQAITVSPGVFDMKWAAVGNGFIPVGTRMSVF